MKFEITTHGENRFETDPYYFFRYYFFSFIVFLFVDFDLYSRYVPPEIEIGLVSYLLFYLPFACYLGGLSLILIHNASHGSCGPSWLNRLLGEIAGTHQLYGFLGWKIAHIIHHAYPDDPERDPHPPGKKTFWKYFLTMRRNFGSVLDNYYEDVWGGDQKHLMFWRLNNVFGLFGVLVRLAFWYLLLGPKLFLLLFVPSYLFNYFAAVHLNYYTHIPSSEQEGKFEILDLQETVYQRFMNAVMFGIYFHKTHHEKPGLFNPAKGS